ncbi:DUF1624 domain-containing protein [Candidatus Latescibacterota bacterium]
MINHKNSSRIESIDLLRGIIMIVMALDHVRDHFTPTGSNILANFPEISTTLFMTRWITNFCAPVFVFLAGMGAFLSGSRGKTKAELARFLFIRGLCLIVLEFTVVHYAWYFHSYPSFDLLVIWVIGCSMIVLAGLVFLPLRAIFVFSLVMILGHNLLDGIHAEDLGYFSWLWMILHEPGTFKIFRGITVEPFYTLIPWIGVMAAGYCTGALMLKEERDRQKWLIAIGAGLTVAFLIIRFINVYGDPIPWSVQDNILYTLLSFVNCDKYPPSLLFLLMTLGPAITLLALLEKASGLLSRLVIVFGRVPLFYYIIHLYLIHALALVTGCVQGYDIRQFLTWFGEFPETFGFSLPVVYVVWIVVILMMYPLCRWYAILKSEKRYGWLRFL